MYMRTVTEPRDTLPSVCAPAGLRRLCAHTSDSRLPIAIRRHLSNPQIVNTRYRLPRDGASTLSISWSLCLGGLGPQRIDRPRHPSFQKSEEGRGIRTPSTNHRPSTANSGGACTGHVAAHIPLHGIPRPPLQPKTKLPDVSNEPPARDHADARRSTEAGS